MSRHNIMDTEMSAELIESLKQAKAIARGELPADRRIVWTTDTDGKPMCVADERNVLLKPSPQPD
jgi:hypothetical protein